MSTAIGSAILEDKAFVSELVTLSRQRLADAYRHTRTTLKRAGISCWKGGNAGFFLYIDLSPWLPVKTGGKVDEREREYVFAQKLLDAGVGLHPCEEHWEEPGHFRLVFSSPREVLDEGLRR
jgi:1-aminocyclopropane-1-carboxylate synthase